MDCPHCKAKIEFPEDEVKVSSGTDNTNLDIQIICPKCQEMAFFTFLELKDFTAADPLK